MLIKYCTPNICDLTAEVDDANQVIDFNGAGHLYTRRAWDSYALVNIVRVNGYEGIVYFPYGRPRVVPADFCPNCKRKIIGFISLRNGHHYRYLPIIKKIKSSN